MESGTGPIAWPVKWLALHLHGPELLGQLIQHAVDVLVSLFRTENLGQLHRLIDHHPIGDLWMMGQLIGRQAQGGPLHRVDTGQGTIETGGQGGIQFVQMGRHAPQQVLKIGHLKGLAILICKKLIDDVLDMFADKLSENAIDLQKFLEADPHIPLDRSQIIGALSNLVANAIDAMPKGGALTIKTRETVYKGVSFLNLDISDTGVGIPAKKLNMIFEPFFTTKALGQGTGLGLPICKRTIEDHGGFISINSKPGQGSTFNILLPYKQAAGKTAVDDT